MALRVSVLEGALHAVMVGVTESYLGAFAVELGHGPRALALLATLPLLLGAGSQLLCPSLCHLLGGRKRLAVAGASTQTLSIVGLAVIGAYELQSFSALLAVKCFFWLSAGAMAPGWSSWMADLTSRSDRARYFARRSGLIQVALLFAFGWAGFVLQRGGAPAPQTFAALFCVGALARAFSAIALSIQPDVTPRPAWRQAEALRRFGDAFRRSRFRVASYAALLAFGTQVAAPFFTPYMLRELALDYGSFAALSAVSILAKALMFPCCQRVAAAFGVARLLWISGVGVAVVPLVWAEASGLPLLALANALGGVAWAGLEYSSFQLLLEGADDDLKTEFFSLSNTLTGVAQVSGAVLGGLLLGADALGYHEVFVLSAGLRALALATLFFAIDPRDFPRRLRRLYPRLLTVRPGAGADQRAIVDAAEQADSSR